MSAIGQAIAIGNITRHGWPAPGEQEGTLYLGSGRMGCCVDGYGLMNRPFNAADTWKTGNTALHHADHWTRGAYGLDYYLPVAQLKWGQGPWPTPLSRSQKLDIHDGVLETALAFPGCELTTTSWFSHACKDVLTVSFDWAGDTGTLPPIVLTPLTHYKTAYSHEISGSVGEVEFSADWRSWRCRLRAGTADTSIVVCLLAGQGSAELREAGCGVELAFGAERGSCTLLIGVAAHARERELMRTLDGIADEDSWRAASIESWHRRWGDGWVEIDEPTVQKMWARSLYYLFCTYSNERISPPSPTGWSGNGWAFHFPQDISYILPALLRLGHTDICRSIVEFYRGMLDDMRAYTRRIYGADGTMWAWEFPCGPNAELLSGEIPNWFQFEIHNAAYPARMAYETYLYTQDRKWGHDVCWPIVAESARFYLSGLTRNEGGTWSLAIKPSMGQDEFGGHDRANYLCALFSAQYCLQTALTMAAALGEPLPEADRMEAILRDGLAYERLLNEELGIYNTFEAHGDGDPFGRQKHPVQLNPLVFLPIHTQPDRYAVRAYHMKTDLCAAIRDNRSDGWTLPAYWLAASHLGDAAGLMSYWNKVREMHLTDRDYTQLYETSGSLGMPFYTTSHGLFLQAVNDAIVSDYWGELQIGAACPPQWGRVSFHNLRTADGRVLSGHRRNGQWELE